MPCDRGIYPDTFFDTSIPTQSHTRRRNTIPVLRRSWNPRMTRSSQRLLEDLISASNADKQCSECRSTEPWDDDHDPIVPGLATRKSSRFSKRLRAVDAIDPSERSGSPRTATASIVSLTISPLQAPAGGTLRCSKFAHDVTKAKQAEARAEGGGGRRADRGGAGARTLPVESAHD